MGLRVKFFVVLAGLFSLVFLFTACDGGPKTDLRVDELVARQSAAEGRLAAVEQALSQKAPSSSVDNIIQRATVLEGQMLDAQGRISALKQDAANYATVAFMAQEIKRAIDEIKPQFVNEQRVRELLGPLSQKLKSFVNGQFTREEFEAFRGELAVQLSLLNDELKRQGTSLTLLQPLVSLAADLSDGQYDFNPVVNPKDIEAIQKSLVVLQAEATFEKIQDGKALSRKEQWLILGVAFAPNKILTVSHSYQYIPEGGWGTVSRRIMLAGRQLSISCEDIGKDFMLIATPSDLALTPLSIPFGNTSELKDGNSVVMFGFPWTAELLIRQGIVAQERLERFSDFEAMLKTSSPGLSKSDFFALSFGITTGDSGSPVFAFRDGKPELVGIVHSYWRDTGLSFGFAIRINSFKPLMDACGP